MTPKPILPYVTTPGITRAYNRVKEIATCPVDLTTAVTILYGGSGSGKTELLNKITREMAWPGPPGDYVRKIVGELQHDELDRTEQCEMARRAGVLHDDRDEACLALLRDRWEQGEYRWRASANVVWGWLEYVSRRLGRPRPDPVGALPMWGIAETITHRYPILIGAMVKDRPSHLQAKLLEALGLHSERLHRFRSFQVVDLLGKMPIVMIVDEADVLHEDSLHALRQVCDFSATPLVLAGTDRLRTRLLSHPALRPLATRVGMRVELGTVTLPDLKKSLPGMDGDVVLEVFRQGGEYFRTICLVLGALRKYQDANPGRRITPEIVQMAAKRVLTAAGVRPAKAARSNQANMVFTDQDLGMESQAEAVYASPAMARPAAAGAVRKVG